MKKIISFIICLAMILTNMPMPAVWAEDNALPQTPEAYAQSDYAKYESRMAAGLRHMAVVKADGTVAAWGDPSYGQTTVPAIATNIKAIAAGSYHTLALKEDGTIIGWGTSVTSKDENDNPVETIPYTIPAELQNAKIKSIAAGVDMSAAVKEDGSVVVWGYNSNLATIQSGLADVVSVAINNNGVVALDKSGHITCWGDSICTDAAPTCGGIVAVASGNRHWIVLKDDGTAVVWGDGSQIDKYSIGIMSQSDIRAVGTGRKYTAALLKDGSVKTYGQGKAVPKNLNGVKNVKAIYVAPTFIGGSATNTLTMQNDGTVSAYGDDAYQQVTQMPDGLNLLSNAAPKSGNADLSALVVSGHNLNPAFDAATTCYAISVPKDVTEVAIAATTSSIKAAMKINGESVANGAAYTAKNLVVGKNDIAVKVTAEDGTDKTYIIVVSRTDGTDKSKDADLTALSVTGYSVNPAFVAGTTGYAISVPNNVTQVAITATTSSVKAAMTINGADAKNGIAYTVKNLVVGNNNISVKVTAEDGTDKIYTITAIRAKDNIVKSSDSNLKGLSVASYDLSPVFNTAVTGYAISVSNDVTGVSIKAVTSDNKATLKINGAAVISDTAYMVGLYVGANTITIKVTAEDNTVKNYTITVNVAEYNGFSPGIPQTMKAYNASEYAQTMSKVIGSGNFLFINPDGSVRRYKNPAHYISAIGTYDLPENLDCVKKVVVSEFNVVALKQNGTVVAWGNKDTGVGNVPDNLSGVTDIAMDFYSNCGLALKEDGTVAAWGDNSFGLCNVPEGVNGVKQIFAARDCFIALMKDGTVVAWGNNSYGVSSVPAGLGRVKELAVDPEGLYVLAIKEDGTVAAWGNNTHGECNVPSDLKNVACIEAKIQNAIAVREDGSVSIWGDNAYGQCDVPEGLKDVVSISYSNGCVAALRANGTVVAWGNNSSKVKNMPAGLHDVVGVKVNGKASEGPSIWAVKKDGTVAVWGSAWGYDSPEVKLLLAKDIISIGDNFIVHRGGILESYAGTAINSLDVADVQTVADNVNLLAGHCFAANDAKLLDSDGKSVSAITAKENYKITANINNYYCEDTKASVLIQVRGGEGAVASGGGRVLGCIKQEKDIPLAGTTVSADFTMPENISGTVYIDVFVWDKGDKPVPKAAPDQSLKVTVN